MKNLVAATYAPMRKDGSLNLDIIEPYGQFLKSNKVAGAFVNGSTGDFVSLSIDERKRLIEAWSINRPKDFYLTNHVGHTNLKEAQELAVHSENLVDAICALPPYYFKPKTLDSLLLYCSEIARQAPSTPFYYYHIPALTGVNFKMIDFLEMAVTSIPNFAGIKYSQYNTTDFVSCMNFNQGSQNILFGVDEKLVSSLPLGAKGWVGSTYNHLAPHYYEIISLFKNGRIEEANSLQLKAVFFVETLDKICGFNGAGKSFMKLFGLDFGPSRFPHETMTEGQLAAAVQVLDEHGVTEYLNNPLS